MKGFPRVEDIRGYRLFHEYSFPKHLEGKNNSDKHRFGIP